MESCRGHGKLYQSTLETPHERDLPSLCESGSDFMGLYPMCGLHNGGGGWGGKVPTQGQVCKWRSAPPTKASTPLTCGLSITGTLAQASRPSGTNSDDAKAATW